MYKAFRIQAGLVWGWNMDQVHVSKAEPLLCRCDLYYTVMIVVSSSGYLFACSSPGSSLLTTIKAMLVTYTAKTFKGSKVSVHVACTHVWEQSSKRSKRLRHQSLVYCQISGHTSYWFDKKQWYCIVFERVWKDKGHDRNCSDTFVFWGWFPLGCVKNKVF